MFTFLSSVICECGHLSSPLDLIGCFVSDFSGCKSNVMVGLWVSDNSYGQSDYTGGQQYVEQYTYI